MRKRPFAVALAAAVVLTFAACGDNGNTSNNSNSSAASSFAASSFAASSSEAKIASLEDWIGSDDCRQAEDATNVELSGTGMSVKLNADGNVFIYEYYLEDDGTIDYSSLTADQLDAAFDPVIEENRRTLDELFTVFEQEYDITLSAIRFTFYTADGSKLYSGEVPNE